MRPRCGSTAAPRTSSRSPTRLAGLDSGDIGVVPGFTGRLLATLRAGRHGALRRAGVPRDGLGAARRCRRRRLHHGRRGQARAGGHRVDRRRVGRTGCDGSWCATAAKLVVGAVTGGRAPATVGAAGCPAPANSLTTTALFDALRAGQVNAAWTTTAAPDIPADVVVLADRTVADPGGEPGAAVPPQRADRAAGARRQRGRRCAGHRRAGADARGRWPTAPTPAPWPTRGWPPTRSAASPPPYPPRASVSVARHAVIRPAFCARSWGLSAHCCASAPRDHPRHDRREQPLIARSGHPHDRGRAPWRPGRPARGPCSCGRRRG